MSDKITYRLVNKGVRERAVQAILSAPDGYCAVIGEETRTQRQNRLMWPLIKDMRGHDENMATFTPDQVKLRFLQTLDNEMQMLPELYGSGSFVVGQRSSTLTKSRFADLIELMFKWGAENGVLWSAKSQDTFNEARINE